MVKTKFKVGDRIRHKETNRDDVYEISKVYDDSYGIAGFTWMIYIKYQDQYELVPNKFDPKILQPFDKVLVKISNDYFNTWYADFVAEPSHVKNETPLILGAKEANMVSPYNDDTKHFVGTTEEALEYYRYWEE